MKYGYARVSSNGQDYDGQVEALKAAGCERVYCDKASGKSIDGRREFERLMKALVPGDAVVVTKLDRLARSSRDLQNILHELQARSCCFLSLGEAWCDTTTDVGRLMLTIMGGLAEFERGLIRKRCDEGIARAISRNRPPTIPQHSCRYLGKSSHTRSLATRTIRSNSNITLNPTVHLQALSARWPALSIPQHAAMAGVNWIKQEARDPANWH